jgi:hypothetical protein
MLAYQCLVFLASDPQFARYLHHTFLSSLLSQTTMSFLCLTYITIFQSNNKEVINYDNVRVSYEPLGTLRHNDKVFVDKYVINAFCRKLFKDKKPKDSKRHYFFSTVGVSLCYSILHYPMLLCIIFLTPFCFSWTFYILLIFSASCTFYLSQFCVFYTDHIYKYMYIF